MTLQLSEVIARAREAAAKRPSDIDTMLRCWTEASSRHVELGRLLELRALFDNVNFPRPERFKSKGIEPPDWFRDASIAARTLPKGRTARGIYRVYVLVLRGAAGARENELGLYVGESHLAPEMRLAQHLNGVNHSRVVQRLGIAALPSFCPHLVKMPRFHSRRLEAELAAKLKGVIMAHGLPATRVQGGH